MRFHEVGIGDLRSGRVRQNRIFHTNIWFRSVNNARYASLLPCLDRVDNLMVRCTDRKILRGVQFRALNATMGIHTRFLFRMAARCYDHGFVTNIRHLPLAGFPVVADVDDPFFTEEEVRVLRSSPHLAALVVTNRAAADRYRDLGVACPIHVIGQGLPEPRSDPRMAGELRRRKRPGELTVGYAAAWHLCGADRGAEPMYDVGHLLDELWPKVASACPRARLWLVGRVGGALERRVAHRPDVELVGHVPPERVADCLAAFDVGLYPRRIAHERASVKVAQYIGCGVPVVGYRGVPTEPVADAGSGLIVDDPERFVDALVRLLRDPSLRAELSARARAAAPRVSWAVLGDRYARLLDEVLPLRRP